MNVIQHLFIKQMLNKIPRLNKMSFMKFFVMKEEVATKIEENRCWTPVYFIIFSGAPFVQSLGSQIQFEFRITNGNMEVGCGVCWLQDQVCIWTGHNCVMLLPCLLHVSMQMVYW
jgi:hypothetical protein